MTPLQEHVSAAFWWAVAALITLSPPHVGPPAWLGWMFAGAAVYALLTGLRLRGR